MLIGALIGTRRVRADVAPQLASVGAVWFAERAAALIERAASGELGVVITEWRDERRASILPVVAELAMRAPNVPVIIYDELSRPAAEMLLMVLERYPGVEYVVRPMEPLGSAVRRLLDDSAGPTMVAPLLLQRVAPLAPPALLPFLTLVVLKGPTGRGVEQLARWAGVTLRTIERRLERAGWAPARVVVQSVRALDAVALMADHKWSARRVQRERRFAHASAITRLMRQYAGVRRSTVREEGGVAAALEIVVQNITHPWPRRRRSTT